MHSRSGNSTQGRSSSWPRQFGRITSAAGCGVGLAVLLGYVVDYEPAWRLASETQSTHPLTASCIALLGFGFFASRGKRSIIRLAGRIAVLAAAAVVVLRLLAPVIGTSVFDGITPFKTVLTAQALAGHPLSMGVNCAHVLFLIAGAEVLRWRRWATASQLFACVAGTILFMALTGRLYDLPEFYGTMPVRNQAGALLLMLSTLWATRRHGFIRPLVAPSEPGRMARLLLRTSTLMILALGWFAVQYTRAHGSSLDVGAQPAYQAVATIILSWVLVTAATVRSDLIDQRHRSAEASLLRAATTDALTGLLNRKQLEHYRSPVLQSFKTAELFIDLDRFRTVNYIFGTVIADDILVEIGQRLVGVSGSLPLGRLGADEFSIVCPDISQDEASQLGFAITAVLAMPFIRQGRSFHLTASVGIGHSDSAGDTNLRRASNIAMGVAKQRGGNQVVVFESSMFENKRAHVELEQYLYEALEQENQLTLAFQPVVDVTSQSLVAVEALARWTHPQLGSIPPSRFIEVAEHSGLVIPLGLKLMAIAVTQAALWRDQYANQAPRINLNISPMQLATGDVIGDLKRMLDQHDLPTSAICLEITEGAFSDAHAASALRRACDFGFTVAMDDFGVGYSSLSQLPRLPITTVKLDRSFIVEASESECGARLLASIAQLARGLDLKVVAEGVETPAQLALVDGVGCDAVQGYIYAQPMTPEALQEWLLQRVAVC